jgi:hypothetical protein
MMAALIKDPVFLLHRLGLSGLRPKLFELIADPSVQITVIEHRDRLMRFGCEYLEDAGVQEPLVRLEGGRGPPLPRLEQDVLGLWLCARLEDAGASTLGYAGFYLLLASVGAQGDLRKVVSHPQFILGGYSSAPIVAAICQPSMAPVGLLLAVLGNVVGTYAGLLVVQALSGLA